MNRRILPSILVLLMLVLFGWSALRVSSAKTEGMPAGRERVVFWHFWGGEERQAVREIVRRFNESQQEFWVEEVPIPGQNLDMKFFMSVAGGDCPDVVNQDDQVIAQWADRGVLTPLRELTETEAEHAELENWLSPAARKIGSVDGELYALCNALDIRALLYRPDLLPGGQAPRTIAELDAIGLRSTDDPARMFYLPDDRRLWAWGVVFGGDFYDEETGTVTANDPRIVQALEWMTSYSEYHGLQNIRAFRSTNREVGAGSMLVDGRYALMMDGQWRVPEFDAKVSETFRYGVAPLPYPVGTGQPNAGWVNGNFFIVPKLAQQKRGAWAFMKFWAGFGGNEAEAAKSAAAGGWVPASPRVIAEPAFQAYLEQHPHFRLFVELAESDNQVPTPAVPVQAYFFERVNLAAEQALALKKSPQQALDEATRDVQRQLDRAR